MCRWYTYICLCLWIYRLYHLCLSCRCAVYILIRVAAAPQMVWYRSHLEQEEHHYQTRPTDTATLAPGCSEDGFKYGKMSKTEEHKWINTSLSNLFTTVCNTASPYVEINVLSHENNTLRQVTSALMSRMIYVCSWHTAEIKWKCMAIWTIMNSVNTLTEWHYTYEYIIIWTHPPRPPHLGEAGVLA